MSLTPKQRKTMRDHLTRKKRNLQRQGASNNEIKAVMGGRWNFDGISDNALERAYNEVKGKGVPKVVNGHVYTRDYIAKSKAWYGDRFSQEKLSQGFRQSQRSELNKFKNAGEVKKYRQTKAREAKDRYISALQEMYDNTSRSQDTKQTKKFQTMISRINRMSASNFGKFLSGGASDKVSFDNVMVFVDTDGKDTAFEFQEGLANEILDNVDNFSKQFVADMKRRKARK